ncbi:putative ribonuclease H-like domain-containing protein [Tanacetum coccineum]
MLQGTYHWGPKRQRFYRYATNMETSKDVYLRHKIITVISLKIIKFFDYSHLEEITVRRQNDMLYKFREGDFKRLRRQDIEDMLLLLVQGKLTNLSLDDRYALNVLLRMYTRRIVIHERVEDLQLAFDESNANVLERFYTSAGNPVNEILLKLNLPDHRILKDVVKKLSNPLLSLVPHLHPKRNFVPTAVATKSGQVPVNAAKQSSPRAATSISTARPVNVVVPKPNVNDALPTSYSFFKAHSMVRRTFNQKSAAKTNNFKEKINTVSFKNVTTAGPKAVVSAAEGNRNNDVKSSACWIWRPKGNLIDHISKDSRSYTPKRFNYGNLQYALQDQGIFDSGCSRHMTGNKSFLIDYQEIDGGFELKFSLLSVSQMCDKKNNVLFTTTEYLVLSPDFKLLDESQVLLKVPRQNNMYNFDLKNVVPSGGLTCLFAKATLDESNIWHRRLGHINFKTMNKLVRGNLVRGLTSKLLENDHTCIACQKGKQNKASCKTKTVSSICTSLQLLHMDLFGSVSIRSINKKSYCLFVTDDFSRFSWVFFLATKDETPEILKNFITSIENQIDHRVKAIRCDNGTEFKNRIMNEFYEMKGIKREFSVARTPQQNGVAKRKNRTLIEELDLTGCTKANIDVGQAGKKIVPGLQYVLLPFLTFNSHGLKKSEDEVAVNDEKKSTDVSKKKNGIQDPAKEGDKNGQEKDVRDQEEVLRKQFEQEFERLFGQGEVANTNSTNRLNNVSSSVNVVSSSFTTVDPGRERAQRNEMFTPVIDAGSSYKILGGSIPVNAATHPNVDLPIDPFMPELDDIADLQDTGIFSGAYDDEVEKEEADFNNLELTTVFSPIPTTRIHKDHPKEQIIGDSLLVPQTRRITKTSQEHAMRLVDFPKGKHAIGTKWVYRNKKDERGIVIRNKARLVTQGYTQEKEIDYDEVFAPVARIEAIRLFLDYAFMRFIMYQMDVKSAFLYGTIEKEVYVCQPPSFEDPQFPDKVYKVEKALYGLHQAPKAWYETLSTYLLENGFRRGIIDKTLFIKKNKGDILLVQVYVDDIIFGSTKKSLCTEFEGLMHKKFQMSSMGELTFFLRLQVMQRDDEILISQDKYIVDILKKFDFSSVKKASTLMKPNKTLIKDAKAEDVDVTPKVSHLQALNRIFRYLKGQPKLGLWYPRDSLFDLEAFFDSDYARASLDRKSTTGGVVDPKSNA